MSTARLFLLLTVFGFCSSHLCPSGWTVFNKSCYGYISQHLPWVTAVGVCRSIGAKLVEIDSAQENKFVQDIIKAQQASKAWIGIDDLLKDREWKLASSEKPLEYKNWLPGEPNNYAGKRQACGSIISSTGGWDDVECDTVTYPFVCERDTY